MGPDRTNAEARSLDRRIVVFSRFSLLSDRAAGWRLARLPEGDYRERLFAEDRLRVRLQTLGTLTLPSLERAAALLERDRPWHHARVDLVVLTSDELPRWARKELEALDVRHVTLQVRALPRTRAYPADMARRLLLDLLELDGRDALVATMTIDDDDVLGDDALVELSAYLDERYIGHAVSFALGLSGELDLARMTYTRLRQLYAPKIALGLSYVNGYSAVDRSLVEPRFATVYGLGSHVAIDEKVPVIMHARESRWIRSVHSGSDVRVGRDGTHWQDQLPVATEESLRECTDPDALPLTRRCRRELSRQKRRYKNVSTITKDAALRRQQAKQAG